MILYEHDVSRLKTVPDAARRVGNQQRFRAQKAQGTHPIDRFGERVTLIIMKPPLHHGDLFAGKLPKHQPPRVSRRRRNREPVNVAVGDRNGVFA
jgi:hypothetical protein